MIKSQQNRGMTLLEIMIALLLLGILSTFVINVVNSVVGLWQQGERRGRGDLVYASVAERLQSDLRAVHLGNRGWMIVDDYVARPATDGVAEWRLPRMRFLASGSSLAADDQSGNHAIEIMWIAIPERVLGPRFAKLVRVAQIEGDGVSLTEGGSTLTTARGENATTIIDGVLDLRFVFDDSSTSFIADAYSGINFPSSMQLQIERVSGNSRKQPPRLDEAVGVETSTVVLRGTGPLKMPRMALIGNEWVGVSGNFPRVKFRTRAERSTISTSYDQRTMVYFPAVYASIHVFLNQGRRVVQ
jgi:prepilin-type N-terminal cleavage/methylation domain-containing protein